jgi:succinate dehydrogenase/fumarate reductase cytochrome b subunit
VTPEARQRLSVVQAALGVVLAAYVLVHLWQQWPVLEGREAWVDRARVFGFPIALKLLVGAAFVAHAVLGVMRLRAPHAADAQGTGALRRVQVALGVLTLGFLLVHVPAMQARPGPASTVRDVYALMWDSFGKPGTLAIYLVGLLAVCGHMGLGLGRAASTLAVAQGASAQLARIAAAALAACVFLCWLQVLACYAIGEPLFFPPSPLMSSEPPP